MDWNKLGIAFLMLFALEFIIIMAVNPLQEDSALPKKFNNETGKLELQKVVTSDRYIQLLLWTTGGLILTLIVYAYMLNLKAQQAKIISWVEAYNDTSEDLKALLHMPPLERLIAGALKEVNPLDEGRKTSITFECDCEKCILKGRLRHVVFDCMSDALTTEIGIRRDSRIVGYYSGFMTYNERKRTLSTKEESIISKIMKNEKLMETLSKSQVATDMLKEEVEQEKNRVEGAKDEE